MSAVSDFWRVVQPVNISAPEPPAAAEINTPEATPKPISVSLSISATVECPKCETEIDLVSQAAENADAEFWNWLKKWIGPVSEDVSLDVECKCGHEFEVKTSKVEW